MEDLSTPSTLAEAFDFTTPVIHDWELRNIRDAIEAENYVDSSHAEDKAIRLDCDIEEFARVVLKGKARTKDFPLTEREKKYLGLKRDRKPGINFEGSMSDGRRIRVKVNWWYGRYTIVTAHEL